MPPRHQVDQWRGNSALRCKKYEILILSQANVLDWNPSGTDDNAGNGRYGACCAEMDIWEANSEATAYTPHVCRDPGLFRCEGLECGDGSDRYSSVCDKDGCDFNSFRMGDPSFLGRGKTIDTTKKITVVTQYACLWPILTAAANFQPSFQIHHC